MKSSDHARVPRPSRPGKSRPKPGAAARDPAASDAGHAGQPVDGPEAAHRGPSPGRQPPSVPPGAGPLPQPLPRSNEEGARPQGKPKLVRDSFTIPKAEYAVVDQLKQRAAQLMRPTKKGELLRAGLAALNAMPDEAFLTALDRVPSLKPGRPKSA